MFQGWKTFGTTFGRSIDYPEFDLGSVWQVPNLARQVTAGSHPRHCTNYSQVAQRVLASQDEWYNRQQPRTRRHTAMDHLPLMEEWKASEELVIGNHLAGPILDSRSDHLRLTSLGIEQADPILAQTELVPKGVFGKKEQPIG